MVELRVDMMAEKMVYKKAAASVETMDEAKAVKWVSKRAA